MATASTWIDRRTTDRRRPPRLFTRHSLLGGRRCGARRAEEREGYIADQHGTGIFVAALAVAALNILDAFYTVLFLSYGGTELNPVVEWLLREGGAWAFVAVKSLGIGLCVAFLTLTRSFRISRVGMALVLIGYGALFCWHLHLLGCVPA